MQKCRISLPDGQVQGGRLLFNGEIYESSKGEVKQRRRHHETSRFEHIKYKSRLETNETSLYPSCCISTFWDRRWQLRFDQQRHLMVGRAIGSLWSWKARHWNSLFLKCIRMISGYIGRLSVIAIGNRWFVCQWRRESGSGSSRLAGELARTVCYGLLEFQVSSAPLTQNGRRTSFWSFFEEFWFLEELACFCEKPRARAAREAQSTESAGGCL